MDFHPYLPTDVTDVVQFVVIFLVIYALLRVVRGTIAASILRGALLMVAAAVVLAAFVLSAFELTILQAILSQLLNAVIFALIVVFQPELRRGLLSLGEHRFFDRFRARPRSCLDDLARAAVNLSRERHGALFAVERRAALNNIVETGVMIDAEARAELLANIFWPGAPMHDGGAVIRGDRVIAAGCIFPLAERRDLTSRLGTRHRAGIGLSEQSDAIIVIVSEETGRVSVAVDGEMRPIDPPGDLARVLRELTETMPEPPPEPGRRRDTAPDGDADDEAVDASPQPGTRGSAAEAGGPSGRDSGRDKGEAA